MGYLHFGRHSRGRISGQLIRQKSELACRSRSESEPRKSRRDWAQVQNAKDIARSCHESTSTGAELDLLRNCRREESVRGIRRRDIVCYLPVGRDSPPTDEGGPASSLPGRREQFPWLTWRWRATYSTLEPPGEPRPSPFAIHGLPKVGDRSFNPGPSSSKGQLAEVNRGKESPR